MARPKAQVHRREDILKIAQKLFRENGYEKTTVDDIAHHTVISKGSVYLEFKTKEDIFYNILEAYIVSQFEKFSELVIHAEPTYLPVLKCFLVNDALKVFDLMGGGYQNCEAMIYTNEEVKVKFIHLIEKWGYLAFELIKKAKENGEINKNLDCESVSKILDIGVVGFYPPYGCNMHYSNECHADITTQDIRNSIEKDLSYYLDILFSGLKHCEGKKHEK
jgi:hypothetical protein